MFGFALLWTAIVLFLVLVAPIWLLAHYLIRWRTTKSLTSEDEKLLMYYDVAAMRLGRE